MTETVHNITSIPEPAKSGLKKFAKRFTVASIAVVAAGALYLKLAQNESEETVNEDVTV